MISEQRKEYNKRYWQKLKETDPEKAKAISRRGTEYQKAHPEKRAQYNKKWRETNPESYKRSGRRNHLKKKFKITPEQFDEMALFQDNRCGICMKETKELCVDHNHVTGKIRKLLCHNCNRALGLFEENAEVMTNAIKYIKEN